MDAPTRYRLQELEDLENELFDNSFNSSTLRGILVDGGQLWVELLDDAIIGYMFVARAAGMADILRLGVHPKHQRKGIGRSLLLEAKRLFPSLMLSVRKGNKGAMSLYKSHGFKISGDLGSSWVMTLTSSAE